MSDPSHQTDPWSWWRSAMEGFAGRAASGGLTQPILPDWTFAGVVINAQNSTSPGTEHAIVARESYGRQIGRIAEALQVLIEERPAGAPANPAIQAFEEMHRRVEAIKAEAGRSRVEQLLADIEELKRTSPAEFQRLAEAFRG